MPQPFPAAAGKPNPDPATAEPLQFSQHASKMLVTHVAKAKRERVRRGLANGSVPAGYRRCDCGQGTDGKCRGQAPKPVPEEFAAVKLAFERYATGAYTATAVAAQLNAAGFRTRNTRRDPEVGVTGPRPFGKEADVDMLRNPFHAGKVRYRDGELVDGAHAPAVSWELFNRVQEQLDHHARHGRSDRTKRIYLLTGLVRCWHCAERLWAITAAGTENRHRTPIAPVLRAKYRGMCHDRGKHDCPSGKCAVPAYVADGQVEQLIKQIRLSTDWQPTALRLLATDGDRAAAEHQRTVVQERLRRAARVYADGNLDEADYERRKREAEADLAALRLPAEEDVLDAGRYLEDISRLWDGGDVPTRRTIVRALFEAI